jgi:hypothetical protein
MVKKQDDKCSKGMILRKGYTAKRGSKTVKVPSSCIRATSYKGVKRSPIDKAKIAQREEIQKAVGKKYGSKRCVSGEIERAGFTRKGYNRKSYVRKNGTNVRAANVRSSEVPPICIRDVGTSGKGYKIPTVLEKGDLKKYGYDHVRNLSVQQRHQALRKANKNIANPLSLFRKLNILSTMNKNRDSNLAKTFKDDANWVKETFGLLNTRPTGRNTRSKSNKQYGSKRNYASTNKSRSKKTVSKRK